MSASAVILAFKQNRISNTALAALLNRARAWSGVTNRVPLGSIAGRAAVIRRKYEAVNEPVSRRGTDTAWSSERTLSYLRGYDSADSD
jgi:hypothetical protein